MAEKNAEVRALFNKLQEEKAALQDHSWPFREKRDSLLKKIQPTLDEIKELEKKYKAIEQPRLSELDNQISLLARSLGAIRMSDGVKDDKATTSTMGV